MGSTSWGRMIVAAARSGAPWCLGWVALGLPATGAAEVRQVGPDKPYATVAEAVAVSASGDVIEVDPGEYVDDWASISVADLTIRGVGEQRPHLRSTVDIPNSKGILVVNPGASLTVENVELSGAFVTEVDGNNGAGIRMQGSSLTVRNCYFHDNQNGILSGGDPGYTVLIEGSEFAFNGNPGSGFEHNVYISGEAASLTFVGNYSHHAFSGHTLKSRAEENYILFNRLMDEADGTSSYLIDLPEGGLAYLVGNLLQQGPQAENQGTLVNYKGEGATNATLRLWAVNNTLVNDTDNPNAAFFRLYEGEQAVFRNNLLVGPGTAIVDASGSIEVVEEANLQTDDPGFVDADGFDYHLLESSMAVNAGVDPGEGDGFDLTPTDQYLHPAALEPRPVDGALDIGAYEWGEVTGGTGTGGSGPTSDTADAGSGSGDSDATSTSTSGSDSAGEPTGQGSGGSTSDTDSQARDEGGDGCGCRFDGGGRGRWLPLLLALTLRRRRFTGSRTR